MWCVISAAAVTTAGAYMAASKQAIERARSEFCCGRKPGDRSLEEMIREHKASMAQAHAETMRGAWVGAALLLALVCAAVWSLADLAGWLA